MTGCRSSRGTVSEKPAEPAGTSDLILTPAERVSELVGSYSNVNGWTGLSVPVTFNVRSPKSISISGRMVMVRNSSISISLRMLGFEVAGLYADLDSIIVYEKLNKSMVIEPMDRLTALTGLTLTDLQDMLTARICYPGTRLDASNVTRLFETNAADGSITLTPRDGRLWSYVLTDTRHPELRLAAVSSSRVRMSCTYSAPSNNSIGTMVPRLTVDASAGKTHLDADINISLSSLKVDSEAKSSRPSVKGYKRINLAHLIKALVGI